MYSVTLSNLQFHIPIGLYPEEQILGNKIEINVELSRELPLNSHPLLDYAKVYNIIATETKQKETLLENLMQRIIQNINRFFPETSIRLEIKKKHPPFGGICDYASIKYDNNANEGSKS